jgi:hypothetical protein
LFIVVVLGNDLDFFGDKIGTVETNTELAWKLAFPTRGQDQESTDHGDVSARHGSFHKLLCAGLCNCAKIVDKICLGHANAGITDGKNAMLLVGGDADVEILLSVELGGVLQGLVADLIKGIRGIGDELSQEDFL